MSTEISREKIGWRVVLDSGLVMGVMDGRNDSLHGHVDEPDPMARSIVFDRDSPRTRAELHLLAEALRQIEHDEITRTPQPSVADTAPQPVGRQRGDDPQTDVCPVCQAYGTQHCSTRSGRDHKARALGWTTSRRPTS